jgi:hypothetical protein
MNQIPSGVTALMEESAMRGVIATAAVALTLGALAPSPSHALLRQLSLTAVYDKCVRLAHARGYTGNELDQNGSAARKFVLRCMNGRRH